jgi:intracellular sulfur oxidation DsrE/DsrF family protein
MNIRTSKEMLHALADNQLDSADIPSLLEEIEASAELQAQLCEIRRVKDLVQHAYPLQQATNNQHTRHWSKSLGKIAATLFLVAGSFSLGWFNSTIHDDAMPDMASTQTQPDKSIIFIGYSDKVKFKQTLARAEELLRSKDNPQSEVYVVASAGGIDMMRSSTSSYQHEIREMMAQYDSLRFVACNNTIYRYKKEGKPVHLLKNVEVAPSAVEFVAERMKKGWNYVSI